MDDLGTFDPHWIWIAIGLVLATAEMLVPGVYLLWLAIAAIITGLLTYGFDLSLPMQVINFSFISLILVFSVKRFLKDSPIVSSDPLLNNRGGRLIGQSAIVSTPFLSGEGRVRQGDSDWNARGPDMDVGERVRIVAVEGTVLRVEPLNLIEAPLASEEATSASETGEPKPGAN